MEHQIKYLENLRFNSLIRKEYEEFSSLCDHNLRYVHTSGTVDDLSNFLNKLNSGYYDYQQIDYEIVDILEMQDCVIVTANFHAQLLVNNEPRSLQNRAVSIWRKHDDQLKLMLYQATPYSSSA